MRLLRRWTTEFAYKPYLGKTEILKDGKHTGRFDVSYGDEVFYRGTMTVPSGNASRELYGIDTSYSQVLLIDNPNADIKEDGLIYWKDNVYEIKPIRPSMNVLAIGLKKMVSNG